MATISSSASDDRWVVLGERQSGGIDGELVLFREELESLTATDLRNALRADASRYEPTTSVARVAAVPRGYVEEYGPYEPVEFSWDGQGFVVTVSFSTRWPDDGQEDTVVDSVARLVEPLLRRLRVGLVDVADDPWRTNVTELGMTVQFEPPLRGRTVKQLFELGEDVLRLCTAFGEKQIARDTVADVVRGGGAHLLVGQPEGNWLDAKSQQYNLKETAGKLSLALAVARFCNAEDGGLIVIGAHARKVPGGEVITRVPGVEVTAGAAARYLQVLNQHLYPLPARLRIDVVEAGDGKSLIIIDVPPQAENAKPFLVHGAIRADGVTEGAFISIVQRRGEGSVPITAPMIHATLAAGRAQLRGNARKMDDQT